MGSKKKQSKKSKAHSSQAPAQAPMMLMSVQQPSHPNQASSSSSSQSEDSADRRDNKTLHGGARIVMKLPKVRVQQLLEAVHPHLDTIFTANLEMFTLCRVLWLEFLYVHKVRFHPSPTR